MTMTCCKSTHIPHVEDLYEKYIKSELWKKYLPNARRQSKPQENTGNGGEFAEDELLQRDKFEPFKCEPKQMVMLMAFIQAASLYRIAGQSLVSNSNKGNISDLLACPLVSRIAHFSLGSLLQSTPTGNPNRFLDAKVRYEEAAFREFWPEEVPENELLKTPKKKDEYCSALVQLFFICLIVRWLGRLAALAEYGRNAKANRIVGKETGVPLRDTDSAKQFADYLVRTAKSTGEISNHQDEQHRDSNPPVLKDAKKMAKFIVEVASNLDDLMQSMWNNRTSRRQVRDSICDHLTASIFGRFSLYENRRNDCKRMPFLVNVMMADMEEIYDRPFGEVTWESTVLGCGGEMGLRLVKDTMKLDSLQKAADCVIKFLHDCSSNLLKVLGWRKWRGVVVSLFKGRKFNYNDIDQTSCKLAIYCLLISPSRSISKKPLPFKNYCHPVFFSGAKYNFYEHCNWMGEHVKSVVQSMIECFEKELLESGTIALPRLALLAKERFPGNGDDLREWAVSRMGKGSKDHPLWVLRVKKQYFAKPPDPEPEAEQPKKRQRRNRK